MHANEITLANRSKGCQFKLVSSTANPDFPIPRAFLPEPRGGHGQSYLLAGDSGLKANMDNGGKVNAAEQARPWQLSA